MTFSIGGIGSIASIANSGSQTTSPPQPSAPDPFFDAVTIVEPDVVFEPSPSLPEDPLTYSITDILSTGDGADGVDSGDALPIDSEQDLAPVADPVADPEPQNTVESDVIGSAFAPPADVPEEATADDPNIVGAEPETEVSASDSAEGEVVEAEPSYAFDASVSAPDEGSSEEQAIAADAAGDEGNLFVQDTGEAAPAEEGEAAEAIADGDDDVPASAASDQAGQAAIAQGNGERSAASEPGLSIASSASSARFSQFAPKPESGPLVATAGASGASTLTAQVAQQSATLRLNPFPQTAAITLPEADTQVAKTQSGVLAQAAYALVTQASFNQDSTLQLLRYG